MLAQERSSWDEALELYGRSLDIMDRTGDRANVSLAKYNIAEILSDQGRQDEAEALLREVIRVWRVTGRRHGRGRRQTGAGQGPRARGRVRGGARAARLRRTPSRSGRGSPAKRSRRRCGSASSRCSPATGRPAASRSATALEMADRTEGGSVFVPALRRLHGAALVQAGAIDEGARRAARRAGCRAEAERRLRDGALARPRRRDRRGRRRRRHPREGRAGRRFASSSAS